MGPKMITDTDMLKSDNPGSIAQQSVIYFCSSNRGSKINTFWMKKFFIYKRNSIKKRYREWENTDKRHGFRHFWRVVLYHL